MDSVHRAVVIAVLCSFVCVGVACSEDTDSHPPSPDDPDPDTGDWTPADIDVALVDVGAGGSDDAGDDTIDCTGDSSLGTLGADAQGTVDIDLNPIDDDELTCASTDGTDLVAHNLRFNLSSPATITWTHLHEGDAPAISFHALGNACDAGAPCQTGPSANFAHPSGSNQTLRIEAPDDVSTATLHFRVDDAICNPGQGWCEDGVYEECYQGESIDSYACADELCGLTSDCAADRCDEALSVEPGSPDSPTVVDGHRHGYTYTNHLDGFDDCELDNVEPDSTELFFAIDDLPGHQALVVENLAQGTYGFFVLPGCDATQCLAVASSDEEFENRLRWVPGGDIDGAIIAVRPSDPVSRAFSLGFYFDELLDSDL